MSPYTNPTSKLYPATRPTRLKRISLPKKLTKKRDLTESIPEELTTDSNSDKKEKDFPQSD